MAYPVTARSWSATAIRPATPRSTPCGTGGGSGLITVGGVAQSFAAQSALGQTGNAAIGASLGTLNEYATQAHASQGDRNTPYSVFAYAGYDSDPAGSGTLGITRDLPHDIVVATAQTARLGADARYSLAPGKWLLTAPGISSATGWGELTAGIRLPVRSNGAVTASLTASVPELQSVTYVARVGLTQAF